MLQLVTFALGAAGLAVAAGMLAVPLGVAVGSLALLYVSWRSA